MNKLSVVSLPLPITSAILGCNLGWISPVAAQEDFLFDVTSSAIPTEFYLALNEGKPSSLQYRWTSLDLDLSFEDTTHQMSFSGVENDLTKFQQNSQSFTEISNNPTDYRLQIEDLNLEGIEFNHKQALDTDQFTQSPSIRDNFNSDLLAKSESFLVIDNLSTSYEQNAAPTAISDTPLNQTLAQIEQYNLQNNLQSQLDLDSEPLTRVSDLRDVKPTDWAYDALKKLVNRYRCFAGYEDNSFRGDRNITRYEFAAALNICLQKIETIAIEKLPEYFNEESLPQLERLTKEFAQELTAIQAETDRVEERIAFLEDHSFSTTTILRGEVVFQMANAFGDKKAVPTGESPTENLDSITTFGARTRLNFETSFTGRDLLRTRLEASNLNGYGISTTGTQMTFLGVSSNTNNSVRLGQVFYRFPLGDKGQAYIAGARQSSSAFIPLLNSASTISLFGFNNPLYDLGFGAGGGFYYQFSDLIGAGATYYSGSPNNPEPSRGFFNGDYSALAQITLTPSDNFGISLAYAHFFTPVPRLTTNLTGFTGSLFAQLPFGLETATASDNFNISFSAQVSDRLSLGGWVGYITATAKSSPADRDFGSDTVFSLGGSQGAKADIWTAALTASYNDIGKLGSKLSFILGLPPKLTNNDVPDREDRDTSLHLELSYDYPLTEKISLTPGVLTITSPEHNSKNGAIVIGLLRSTFRF